tara:strand:- start:165 stop:1256 length:1092 start_codon:yes stop_codon:yes gene_type:complete
MRKLLVILLAVFSLQVSAQEKKIDIKKIFKFGTVYGAVNGGTSLSDEDAFSVTNGLQTSTIETPYDYSILFGVRKIKKFGYQPKEAFKNGTENSFSDAATLGLWKNKIEFLFQGEYKRQQGETYLDQHHFIRYVGTDGCTEKFCWKHFIVKVEYLEDGFADIKYFEASERLTYKPTQVENLTFNIGAAQRLAEPYGYDPLEEWLLSNGNLHYTELALQEGYTVVFDGQGGVEYRDPSGYQVATSTEVWEAVVIPEVLANYSEKKRSKLENTIQHSFVIGADYYKYSKKSWMHAWGNVMPYHYNAGGEFSYHEFIGGQWMDYSAGIVYGHWINKNLGVFIEGTYNKYWNREWHGFSAGINYRVF